MEDSIALIRRLADGKFHSGEAIARSQGVSRAMVWKRIKRLREQFSLNIDSVRGRGYRLSHPIELLEEKRIFGQLKEQSAQTAKLHLHHAIDSTNSWLMRESANGAPSATICLAEQQTDGRGRFGRRWVSPFGANIYLSILWRYNLSPTETSGLSLASGVAVVRALEAAGLKGVGLKWPNDLLWNGRKLAGLLLEVAGESAGPSHVVVGVGLNTRLGEHFSEMIDQPWVDLASIPGGTEISRNRLVALLIDSLLDLLAKYDGGGLRPYIPVWKQYDLYHGKSVVLHSGNKKIIGIHKGIDDSGALLLDLPEGTKAFHAGEVSLSPVNNEPL